MKPISCMNRHHILGRGVNQHRLVCGRTEHSASHPTAFMLRTHHRRSELGIQGYEIF